MKKKCIMCVCLCFFFLFVNLMGVIPILSLFLKSMNCLTSIGFHIFCYAAMDMSKINSTDPALDVMNRYAVIAVHSSKFYDVVNIYKKAAVLQRIIRFDM